MQDRLSGKIAVVLGAGGAGNMGQAIARRFHRDGAQLVLAGRNVRDLEELASDVDGVVVQCDITRESDLEHLCRSTIQSFGCIDIAVNCVGLNLSAPFLETTASQLDQLYAVQFKGPFQFLQQMIRAISQNGSIIQISSAAGSMLLDDYAAYRGTKAGIDQVVRSVADEFGARGIRVNTISPGVVRTPMTEALWQAPEAVRLFEDSSPLGRLASADEIAAAAAFLASDECFMTGENLHVSGGIMLRKNPSRGDLEAIV